MGKSESLRCDWSWEQSCSADCRMFVCMCVFVGLCVCVCYCWTFLIKPSVITLIFSPQKSEKSWKSKLVVSQLCSFRSSRSVQLHWVMTLADTGSKRGREEFRVPSYLFFSRISAWLKKWPHHIITWSFGPTSIQEEVSGSAEHANMCRSTFIIPSQQ